MTTITLSEETECELPPDVRSTWITVDGFSVYVRRTDEGVAVDILALDQEDRDAIASAYAFTSELESGESVNALDAMHEQYIADSERED